MYLRGRICSDNCTRCKTEIEVAEQTVHLTQSQYTDTGPTSPNADPITPGAWQGSRWGCQFVSHWYGSTPEKSLRKWNSNPGSSAVEADALTTRPTRRFVQREGGVLTRYGGRSNNNGGIIISNHSASASSRKASRYHCRYYLLGILQLTAEMRSL